MSEDQRISNSHDARPQQFGPRDAHAGDASDGQTGAAACAPAWVGRFLHSSTEWDTSEFGGCETAE